MRDMLDSLGEMARFASRIRNTNPELVSENVSKQIDEALKVMGANADNGSFKIDHQVSTVKASLDGCPFHYCDSKPVCENKCRYK